MSAAGCIISTSVRRKDADACIVAGFHQQIPVPLH